MLCGACNKSTKGKNGDDSSSIITCSKCSSIYHTLCLNMTREDHKVLRSKQNQFICPSCKVKSKKNNSDNTPIRAKLHRPERELTGSDFMLSAQNLMSMEVPAQTMSSFTKAVTLLACLLGLSLASVPAYNAGYAGHGYGAHGNGYGAYGSGYGAYGSGYGAYGSGYGAYGSGYGAYSNGYGAHSSGFGANGSGLGAYGNDYGAYSNGASYSVHPGDVSYTNVVKHDSPKSYLGAYGGYGAGLINGVGVNGQYGAAGWPNSGLGYAGAYGNAYNYGAGYGGYGAGSAYGYGGYGNNAW